MFQNGANKGAAKRAAFGDVSNTAKPIHAGRDDISLAGKKQTKGAEKAALIVEKKSSLAQPAQRPMSMAGMKGLLSNVPNAKPIEPSKQIAMQQQTANTRKILNKRATVFKDASEPSNNKCEITSKETNTELEEGDNKASLAQASAAAKRTTTKEAATHEEAKPVLEDTEENSIVDSEVDEAEKALLEADDDHCKVQDHSEDPKPRELPAAPEVPESHRVAKAHRDSASTSHAPAQSEPEDWDEEDEHEEEDGYITARSYRSRGENTTGGATTVLFPKFTQQVRRELALAEQVVEATRTEEDIEDEWYDTSMVAEYSEEIFEYMREQEVRTKSRGPTVSII